MNAVDASTRDAETETGVPPSLLTIILDTNPHAWGVLSTTLPLPTLIANLLVFINAHLAINNSNQIAIIASHSNSAVFLYPQQPSTPSTTSNDVSTDENAANKYRPFAQLERTLTTNLRSLLSSTTPSDLQTTSTKLAGALTLALTYTAKATLNSPSRANDGAYDASNTPSNFTPTTADGTSKPSTSGLHSRILILSASGDIASQYIPIMNSIFACQRLGVPIDILALAAHSHAEFLQQAADATGGVYMALGEKVAGLLQVLMMGYLPDATARRWMVKAGEAEGVDFRAACFCHRNIIDLGYVCSICLSIFCESPPDDTCLTCGTALSLAGHPKKPVVVRRKKKKRRIDGVTPADSPTPSAADTPGR